jgi:hypothetical protein
VVDVSGGLRFWRALRHLPRWGLIVSGLLFLGFAVAGAANDERGSLGVLGAAGVFGCTLCLAVVAAARSRRAVRS